MAKVVVLEIGDEDDRVVEGVFVCHVLGENGLEVRTISYNAPPASANIGMLTQALDRIRAVQTQRWK